MSSNQRGAVAVESIFGLIFFMLGILAFISSCLYGMRVLFSVSAASASVNRMEAFMEPLSGMKIEDDGSSNSKPRRVRMTMNYPGLFRSESFDSKISISRNVVPVLPPGLGDGELRGGDMPSPFCTSIGGYARCGW